MGTCLPPDARLRARATEQVRLPEQASIVEVGPRDGLQSLPDVHPVEVRLAMIEALVQAGLRRIEVTSFVRDEVVPQLAGAEALVARLPQREGCTYRALVANRRGAERAAEAGLQEVLGLTTASPTYTRKNQNMTLEENLAAVSAIAAVARDARMRLVVTIGLALFCPYEGEIPEERVLGMVERIRGEGVDEIVVSTSAGLDGPRRVHGLCARLLDRWPDMRLGVHLHDANGMAMVNALAALEAGATVLESSICGLGGGIRMPTGFPPNGNVATEDLTGLLAELGVDTGVDPAAVLVAGRTVEALVGSEFARGHARVGATKARCLELGRSATTWDAAGRPVSSGQITPSTRSESSSSSSMPSSPP